jgi:hypothetical protein
MDDEQLEEALRNWTHGNLSVLDRVDLIAIARHYKQRADDAEARLEDGNEPPDKDGPDL